MAAGAGIGVWRGNSQLRRLTFAQQFAFFREDGHGALVPCARGLRPAGPIANIELGREQVSAMGDDLFEAKPAAIDVNLLE